MSWESVKAAVNAVITSNGNKEITGQVLRELLTNNIIPQLGIDKYKGIAVPSTVPTASPEYQQFYFAYKPGIYSNFAGKEIENGEIGILFWTGTAWNKETISYNNPFEYFPFASQDLLTSKVLRQVSRAIKEAYVPSYDSAYDYLFSVLRRNQLVSGTYYYEVRITKVQKGTATSVAVYNMQITSANPINYDEGDGLQLLSLSSGGAYVIIDWNEIEEGTGYGQVSTAYLASEKLGNLNYNKRIANYLNNYTKTEADSKFATIVNLNLKANSADVYTKSQSDLAFKTKNSFPYASKALITTDILVRSSKAVKELYIPDYDEAYDYLFSVLRYKQDVSGTVYVDIRLAQVQKGTATLVKYYQFTKYGAGAVNYDIGDGLQLLDLTNGGNILIDWNELVEGEGYGNLSTSYLASNLIGNVEYNKRINTYAKKDVGYYFESRNFFPYASESLVNTDILKQVRNAVKELYIPDYDEAYDYLFSVFRRNQLYLGEYRYDVRLAQVQKGTATLVKYYAFTITDVNPVVYDEGDGLQLIELSNGGYIILDWNEVDDGTGYGNLSTSYLASHLVGNLVYNKRIATEVLSGVADAYTKAEADAKFAEKTDVYLTSETYNKTESDNNFAAKSTTETQLADHETRVGNNETNIATIQTDYSVINGKLDLLVADPPTGGAITGNNVWTGQNGFIQPVEGVAATGDTHFIRKGEYKQTLNRFVNAADYGFDPAETAANNTVYFQNAVDGGNKTILVTKPGIYEMSNMVYLDDNTTIIFGAGIILKKAASFMSILINRGALTHSYNSNIKIIGLHIDCNQIDSLPGLSSPLYGLRGHTSFMCVNNLEIYDYKCFNYNTPQWAVHVCTFNNFILDGFECVGNKDGVHLGRGDGFIIKNGKCETYDDAVALNAHDYTSCNPEIGDIRNGIIENVIDVNKATTTGYFTRILLGAWVDWYLGMNIRNGDAVVNNGRVYRAIGTPSTDYASQTEPISIAFDETVADGAGFTWKLFQNDAVYQANIFNVEYRKIQGLDPRTFINFEIDTSGSFNRSLHPDVQPEDYPHCKKLKVKDCYMPAVTRIISAKTMYDIEIDNIYGHNSEITLSSVNALTGIASATIKNCDFRDVTGNAIAIGSNVHVKIRDCQHDGDINITCSGRLDSNENLSTITGIIPQKGDSVKYQGTVKLYNGSVWVDLN